MRSPWAKLVNALKQHPVAYSVVGLFLGVCAIYIAADVARSGWHGLNRAFGLLVLAVGVSALFSGIPMWASVFDSGAVFLAGLFGEVALAASLYRYNRRRDDCTPAGAVVLAVLGTLAVSCCLNILAMALSPDSFGY